MSREAFLAELNKRLDAGAKEYGDRSFQRAPGDLLGELEQECLDLAGWGFCLFTRVRSLKERAAIADPFALELRRRFVKHFESRIDRSGDCWIWQGKIVKSGYGQTTLPDGRKTGAHRVAWAIANNDWPAHELHVLHSCDNPPCCNPKHLRLGTDADNARDRSDRGRDGSEKRSGVHNHRAKLTDGQVVEMRSLYAAGDVTLRALGIRYGVTYQCVRSVVLGETWTHVPQETL